MTAADDEAPSIPPSERRVPTIEEVSVAVEMHCRKVGHPDLGAELAGVLRQIVVDGDQP